MTNEKVRTGLALVTAKGLVFKDNIYTNSQMIKYQWFEHPQNLASGSAQLDTSNLVQNTLCCLIMNRWRWQPVLK